MFRTLGLLVAFAAATAAPTLAQRLPPQPPPPSLPGSAKERAACHSDVIRWCSTLLPKDPNGRVDTFAIASCLQSNRTKISAACRSVLEGHGR